MSPWLRRPWPLARTEAPIRSSSSGCFVEIDDDRLVAVVGPRVARHMLVAVAVLELVERGERVAEVVDDHAAVRAAARRRARHRRRRELRGLPRLRCRRAW